jgi:uncharacterized caspase-like protein
MGLDGIHLGRAGAAEQRIALVLVNSRYRGGFDPLPGAAVDGERVARALRRAGFETRLEVDLTVAETEAALAQFRAASESADTAVIYTTGHGLEFGGEIYLIARDFARKAGRVALATHATPLRRVAASMTARSANLLFYAGCRDDPFASK